MELRPSRQVQSHRAWIRSRTVGTFVRTAMFALAVIAVAACGGLNTASNDDVDLVVSDTPIVDSSSTDDPSVVVTEAFVLAVAKPTPDEVHFYLDDPQLEGEPMAIDTSEPFEFSFDVSNLSEGVHTITAVIKHIRGKNEVTMVEHTDFLVSRTATPDTSGGTRVLGSLRGDAAFSESSLDADAKTWYRRLWQAVENPNAYPNALGAGDDGCLYVYGRTINEYLTSVAFGLRATGDLQFLDEADRILQVLRGSLQTKWRDANGNYYTPTDGTQGMQRWLWLKSTRHEDLYGRDTHEMDALMTHGMIAMFAYAYQINRDLMSPSGIDYGERAAFWLDYLKNDFEQIWRTRNGVSTGFPFLRRNLSHPWVSSIRYHHYMYLLTGDGGYREELGYLTQMLMADQVEVDTKVGRAYVWAHGVISGGSANNWLQGTIYVKYDLMMRGELVLERARSELSEAHMQKMANALSQFVDDGDTANTGQRFAASIGGDTSRGGISFKSGWRSRETEPRWAVSGLAFGAVWDDTGLVDRINDDVYAVVESDPNNPRRVHIPAAKLLMHALN